MRTNEDALGYPDEDMLDTQSYEAALLTDDDLLAALMTDCLEDPAMIVEGFADNVMASLPPRLTVAPKKTAKPGSEERLWAAFCFSAAAAVLLLGFFGMGDAVTDMLGGVSGKLSELLAIVSVK